MLIELPIKIAVNFIVLFTHLCRVEPYLKKCFAGIQKLRFNADADITGIISDIDEELHLSEIIDTGSCRGQVEKWLVDLERVMRNSVKQVNVPTLFCLFVIKLSCTYSHVGHRWQEIKKALAECETRSYEEWICSWTQQVVCLVSGIVTTTELSRRLLDTELLREFLNELNVKIEKMITTMSARLQMKKRYVLGMRRSFHKVPSGNNAHRLIPSDRWK